MSDENQPWNMAGGRVKGVARSFLLRVKLNKHINVISTLGKISTGKLWPSSEIEQITNKQKIMVISPHPDDDVIGCGGTLKLFCEKGSQVKIIIMSDGRFATGTAEEYDLVRIRKEEERMGSSILGCNDLIFLDNIDTKLRANIKNKKVILGILNDFNPDKIFIPSIFENHPDHIESAVILAYALREYQGQPLCYCYEVWNPLFPNTLIDITNCVEEKTKAINAHWSQVTHQNFVNSILGLNSYRAFGLGKDIKSCEAFYKCSKEEFISMVLK